MFVAVAMRQVEQAVGNERRGAVRRDVLQPGGDHRRRLVEAISRVTTAAPNISSALPERLGVEADRATVVGALVGRQFAGEAVGTPFAEGDAGR